MRNNSQKQYNIRVTILHGEEKNGTQRFIGGSKESKTANLGEEYESETTTSVALV